MRSSVWKLRESELQLAWFVLFFSSFPMHLVQSVAGQQLPSHIPLIKIGGQSRVVAGVTLEGGRRRFSGVLSASGAHRRGGGGLVPRTGCRGRVRPLGFVHLKPRGRDGSEASGTLLAGPGCSPCRRVTVQQQLGPCPAGHRAPATTPAVGPDTRGAAAPQHEGLQPTGQAALAQPSHTEPCSANWAALAPAGAQTETTPFPWAVLRPQPGHRALLGPCWEHGDQHCPALGERTLSTPATEHRCPGRKGLEHWGDLPSCVS